MNKYVSYIAYTFMTIAGILIILNGTELIKIALSGPIAGTLLGSAPILSAGTKWIGIGAAAIGAILIALALLFLFNIFNIMDNWRKVGSIGAVLVSALTMFLNGGILMGGYKNMLGPIIGIIAGVLVYVNK